MSKIVNAPEQEVITVAVPAEASPVVEGVMESVAVLEPVALTGAAKKPVSKKPAATKVVAKNSVPTKPVAKKADAVVKPAAKTKAQVAAKAVAESADLAAPEKSTKEHKPKKAAPKKAKLVRDSFTFPENDYVLLAVLKQRALSAGHEIKKSELLRAGLSALAAMSEADLLKALDGVERIKTGRPSK